MKYNVGSTIYLKTDVDQLERMVTGILIEQSGIQYRVSCGIDISWHYEFELSTERDIVKVTNS